MASDLANIILSISNSQLSGELQKVLDKFYCIIVFDDKKEITYINKNFSKLSGYNNKQLKNLPESLSGKILNKKNLNAVWKSLKTKGDWKGHIQFRKKGGESLWLDVSALGIKDANSNISQAMFIASNITDYKNAMEIKSMFLSNMSHELRTPLNGILGLANLLNESTLNAEQKNYIYELKNASLTMLKMVDDLIDLNKIEGGKMKIEEHPFFLKELVNQVIALYSTKIKEKNIEFKLSFNKNIQDKLKGDSFRLKQILMQLLENAINFTKTGHVVLEITKIAKIKNKDKIQFTVSDSGIGIPKDKLSFILEKFNQADMQNTRQIGGAGLGLTIAKNIIELQGGEFKIYSKEGKGTKVVFSIAFSKPSKKTTQESETIISDKEKEITVLIAEDVPLNQLVMKKLMQKFGYKSEVAANGLEALEKLKKRKYDIILMDMQMPIMDGFEAIKEIRNNFPEPKKNTPIISISANIMNDANTLCIKAGADDYISKPFENSKLLNKMKSLIINNQSNEKQ